MRAFTCLQCRKKWNISAKSIRSKCSCGGKLQEKQTESFVPHESKQNDVFGVGSHLRKMLGCGCGSIPFAEWDKNGVQWCRENQEKIVVEILVAPKIKWSLSSIRRFVAKAVRYRIALMLPNTPHWSGPARAGLFVNVLESNGYSARTVSPNESKQELENEVDLVCNHCMVADMRVIEAAAKANPQTVFVNLNHSAIPHTERSAGHYTRGFSESLRLARELPNCWYASQDQPAEDIGKATGIERCIWLPTPGKAIEPREYRPPGEKAVVTIAGRQDVIKNNLAQLIACGLVKDRVRLVLCMEPSKAMQGMLDQMGIDHEWRGKLPHGDWLDFLQREPDVVLCCSLAESFGYVAAEAMQSGIPVVASDAIRFATPELVATTGSPNEIAAKILLAIDDHANQAAEAARRGREAIDEQNREYVARIGRLLDSSG